MNSRVSANSLPNKILGAISEALGPAPIALHEPNFGGNEWNYLQECLESTYVSSVGKFVDQFEDGLEKFTGAKHVIAVVNGTSALHIALKLAGVKAHDEVLIPALTFVATANAVTYCGAIPHFVDSNETTLGIDPIKLRRYLEQSTTRTSNNQCVNKTSGQVISAIIPMHTFGHPVEIEDLLSISKDFNIPLVEDAAESLGSFYKRKHTGTFGLIGVLSFNGNKIITTGGGGAILTDNDEIARRAKHITTTAKLPHRWEFRHDEIGYNYRMPNLNAALGCAQLEQLSEKIMAKRVLFDKYSAVFSEMKEFELFSEPNNCRSNYWLQTILLSEDYSDLQNLILETTNSAGYMTRPSWVLLNELEPFKNCPAMYLETSRSLSRRIINLPSSAGLALSKP